MAVLFGCRVGKRRVQVRRYGFQLGGCRDRGLHLRERVLHRRVVRRQCCEPAGRGAAVTVSAAAAGPRPTGVGTTYQQRHAHTDRYRGGDTAERETARWQTGARGAANRNGFSMKRRVSTASPPETRTAANLPASPSGWPSNGGASSSTGQCHRYHEYDTRPIARIGGNARTRPHP